jgi:hypothetical protein
MNKDIESAVDKPCRADPIFAGQMTQRNRIIKKPLPPIMAG